MVRDRRKKESSTVSVLYIYCTLPTSEGLYRAYTIHTTPTYKKDVGSYSTVMKESKMNKQKKSSSSYGKPLVLKADVKHLLKIVADT